MLRTDTKKEKKRKQKGKNTLYTSQPVQTGLRCVRNGTQWADKMGHI